MSFQCTQYLATHPKAFSWGKHFINQLTGYAVLTSMTLTLHILLLSSANSNCLPITHTT